MRIQTFLNHMKSYDFTKALTISTLNAFRGGWEVWFQVEIALHMRAYNGFQGVEREVPYPNPPAHGGERCDFRISATERGNADITYIELKCINPNNANPIANILTRFSQDIGKIELLRHNTYSCFALAAIQGRLRRAENGEPYIARGVEEFYIRRMANPTKSIYLLVPGVDPIFIQSNTVILADDRADSNLYLIGVSDNR